MDDTCYATRVLIVTNWKTANIPVIKNGSGKKIHYIMLTCKVTCNW